MESDSLHEYDKSWKAFFITTLFILCTVNAYAQSSDTIFPDISVMRRTSQMRTLARK